jgi:ABC-type antimicrobial peptide transport system permease subunit
VVKLRKPEHGKDFRRLKQVFMQESGVVAASGCSKKIVGDVGSMIPVPAKGEKAAPPTWFLTTDEDYAATMSLQVKEGRWFQANHADGNFVSVVNETYLRSMQQEYGKDTSVIGSKILGVVRDFHFDSMLEPIQPMEVRLPYVDDSTKKEDIAMNYIMVKLAKGNHEETMKRLEAAWNLAVQNTPFEASFFDDEIQSLYKREQTMTALVGGIGSVIVVVACLGLFGLAAFTAEMRTKEIGIRKVLGASVKSIIALLSRDFLRLVVIAIIIAVPLGYWAMGQWLQGFAYRTELGAGVFFFAGAMAVGIAFMTVAGQAFRAARTNPVQSLRSE